MKQMSAISAVYLSEIPCISHLHTLRDGCDVLEMYCVGCSWRRGCETRMRMNVVLDVRCNC